MSALRSLLSRLAATFRRSSPDSELDEEFKTHISLLTEEYMRHGMSAKEARQVALREFGGTTKTKESYYEQRNVPALETFWQDLRYGVRTLLKSRTFTIAAILTLALGIGGTVAVFSLVNSILLRDLPYPAPDRLVTLIETSEKSGEMSASWYNFQDWRARAKSFSEMAAIQPRSLALTRHGEPERLPALNVSASFFPLLRTQPATGRDFQPPDDRVSAPPVVILSHNLWQRRFAGNSSIIGQSILLDGRPHTIIGVLPASFRFFLEADLFRPVGLFANEMGTRGNHAGLQILGRMHPGATLEQARVEMDTIAAQLRAEYPEFNSSSFVKVEQLSTYLTGGLRKNLWILLGAVGCVLLIACANVSNLLLARATARRREFELRSALGASRNRLIRQLLTESLLLACAGAALGIGIAHLSLRIWTRLVPEEIARVTDIGIDPIALAAASLLTAITAFAFGLAPAWLMARGAQSNTLGSGTRSASSGFRGFSIQNTLVGVQIAVALVLLLGAGLLFRSLVNIYQVNPGFRADHLMTMQLVVPVTQYPDALQRAVFADQILSRVEHLPGVESASTAFCLPLNGGCWGSILLIQGRPTPARADLPIVEVNSIHPDYFRTLGVPLLRGRDFNEQDTVGRPRVVIVNQNFAKKYLPNEDPLGKQVKLDWPESKEPYQTIIGVVGDVRRFSLTEAVRPEVFQSANQDSPTVLNLVVRTKIAEPLSLAHTIKQEINHLDPELSIHQVRSIDYYLAQSSASRRFPLILLGAFAGLALILAAIGLYGVMSYLVSLRTQELGIRLAMGAGPEEIVRLIVKHGAKLAAAGIGVGLIVSLGLTRLLERLLFGVQRTDPLTFAAVVSILALTALAACWFPARRAARIDPAIALRSE